MNSKLSTLASSCRGKLIGEDRSIESISIDTRTLKPGALYIALVGENFDGHDFIDEAVSKGAAAVLVSKQSETSVPTISVNDSKLALGQMAQHHRDQYDLPIIALTGSCGKTTVKEMIAAILTEAGKTLSTMGNLNNEIGVPLTLNRLNEEHEYAVIELGANHAGEIAYTVDLVKPNVALITNIAPAHLEGFGSVEGVAKAKSEIFSGLSKNGTAILNADERFSASWRQMLTSHRILSYGLYNPADVSATNIQMTSTGSYKFQMSTPKGRVAVILPLLGKHNITNALAATAATLALNISLEKIAEGLGKVSAVKGRLKAYPLKNKSLLIDDTYNANPKSVSAAIDVLADFSTRKILVFGDMGELGAEVKSLHRQIGKYAKDNHIHELYTFGEFSREAALAFGEEALHFETQDELIQHLKQQALSDVTILVKGSRSMKMENIVESLLNA